MTNLGKPVFLTPDDLTDAQIEDMKEEIRNRRTTGIVIPAKEDLQIIRSKEELEALDPDTYLLDRSDDCMSKSDWQGHYGLFDNFLFPLAVMSNGNHVRAAREALEKENT